MARTTGFGKTTTAKTGGMVIGGGAVAMIIAWAAKEFFAINIPPEVAVALGSVCAWLVDLINPKT